MSEVERFSWTPRGMEEHPTGVYVLHEDLAPPAVWSREKPTVEGHYWYRTDKDDRPDIVRLRKYSLGLFFKAIGDIEDWSGEWSSSPLRPPVEGKG